MKDLSEQSYYEVLELAPGCAAAALLKAYSLARERYGPGSLTTYALAEPSEAEAVLRRVEEAFAVLSDPERRQAYDTAGGFAFTAPAPELSTQPASTAPVSEPSPPVPEPLQAAEPVPAASAAPEPISPPEPEPARESREAAAADLPAEPSQAAGETASKTEHDVSPEPGQGREEKPEEKPEARAEVRAEAKSDPKPEAEHKPIRKTESDLPADSAVTGEALRRVREARGLSLKDVESRTKIGHWHLENIERERYADLPAQVYLRGFLMSFARELKLDPVRVARSYLEQMKTKPQAKPE